MASEAPHRHLSTAITITVLVALLVVGAAFGFKSLFAPLPDDEEDPMVVPPACTPQTIDSGGRLTAAEVTVSVFNASTVSGLAAETLDDLTGRGFEAGDIGNSDAGVEVVEIWTTQRNDPAAKLVARQFGAQTRVRVTDQDLGAGIDVIVGANVGELVPAKDFIKTKETVEGCESSGS